MLALPASRFVATMTPSIEAAVPQSRNRAMRARPRYACQLIIAALGALAAPSFAAAQTVDPDAVLAHIRYLASDELKGREAGDEGADSAAAYIARQMEGFGLELAVPVPQRRRVWAERPNVVLRSKDPGLHLFTGARSEYHRPEDD